jgi:hypothetical protein
MFIIPAPSVYCSWVHASPKTKPTCMPAIHDLVKSTLHQQHLLPNRPPEKLPMRAQCQKSSWLIGRWSNRSNMHAGCQKNRAASRTDAGHLLLSSQLSAGVYWVGAAADKPHWQCVGEHASKCQGKSIPQLLVTCC